MEARRPRGARDRSGRSALAGLGLIGLVLATASAGCGGEGPGGKAGVPGLRPGATGILRGPDAAGVRLANAFEDIDAPDEAQAGGSREGLASAGRFQRYPNGSKVQIEEVRGGALFVQILSGEDKGRSGWVRAERVRPGP